MKFKKVETRGKFWIPPQSEAASGTLTISDEGNITLDIDEIRLDIDELQLDEDSIQQIIGQIEGGQFAIFKDCILTHFTFLHGSNTGPLSKRGFRAMQAFVGFPERPENVPYFNSLKFSIEGLDQWVNIRGIKNDTGTGDISDVTYECPETISFDIGNGMTINVEFDYTMHRSLNPSEVKFTEKVYVQLISSMPQDIDHFISVAEKVRKLLCFVMNKHVSFDSVSADPNLDGKDSINIYGPRIRKVPVDNNRMLFMFSNGQRDPNDPSVHIGSNVIKKWVGLYEEYEVAFDLYFNAQTIQQPDLKFLLLAQGLEVFHQIRYGMPADSRYIYKHRILDMLKEPFVTSGETLHLVSDETTSKLVNALKANDDYMRNFTAESSSTSELDMAIYYLTCYIRDTRNYLTHYNKVLKPPKSASGVGLYYLCLKLEMLLELHFLHLLGGEEIPRVPTNSDLSEKRNAPLDVTQ